MRVNTYYTCEYCNLVYNSAEDAEKCEASCAQQEYGHICFKAWDKDLNKIVSAKKLSVARIVYIPEEIPQEILSIIRDTLERYGPTDELMNDELNMPGLWTYDEDTCMWEFTLSAIEDLRSRADTLENIYRKVAIAMY